VGKALSINDTATYELVVELAFQSGLSLAQAVDKAAKSHLETIIQRRVEHARLWLAKVKENGVSDDFMVARWQPPIEPQA
jgi:hypothetical protein